MIGYVTLGSNDVAKAADFYDQLLSIIGATRFMESEKFVAWSVSPKSPALSVTTPFDGNAATVGQRRHGGAGGRQPPTRSMRCTPRPSN